MSGVRKARFSPGLLVEYILMSIVVASVVAVARFFFEFHYLPQPFVFDTNDTFMDWFNTALFAYAPGAFDVWRTVYPPLSFVFLRIFSINSCYTYPFLARDCDWVGVSTLVSFYVVNCVLAYVAFRRNDRSTALPRGLVFGLGMPLLFCFERGNLILVCLPAFIVGYSGMFRSVWARAFAIAVTINFKPYLVVPSFSLAVRRDWRGLELAGLATFFVYLVTFTIYGSGSPIEIVENLSNFAGITQHQFLWQDFYFSTSYSSLLSLGAAFEAPLLAFVPSRVVDIIAWLIPLIIASTQLAALMGLAAAWLQPRAVPLARNVALLAGVHLATKSPGGYALVFIIFPVFLEKGRRPAQVAAIIAAYLLSITYDQVVATVINSNSVSWLSGGVAVHMKFGLAVGQFVRPALVVLIVWALALDNITLSILAHRSTRPSVGMRMVEERDFVRPQTFSLGNQKGEV